jgi:hypothetical protein
MKKQKFDVLSPDGFSIHYSDTYPSEKKAIEAFDKWKKRYESQGYYSSNNGRIHLEDIVDYCTIVAV